jgi:predicted nucleic acid-binding protein
MSRWVIDASVLVKLFIEEDGSREAAATLKPNDVLLAPDLLWSEVGNILWKYVRRGDLSPEDAEQLLDDMLQMPIEITCAADVVESALRIAIETDRTVYDCLYLSVAIDRKCRLLTADERFVNSLAKTPFAKHIQHVAKTT